jgi:acetyl-CoA C-acetyltransferase
MSGQQDLVVGGGVEKMSDSPIMPMPLLTDSNNAHLRELHPTAHQGVCADVIATLDGFTREQADALAVESQRRAANAIKQGYFKSVVAVHDYDGNLVLDQDNYNRPGTSMESLSALSPAFAEFYDRPLDDDQVTCRELVEKSWPDLTLKHIHHAGNSSGIVDGAASVLLASENYAKQNGLTKRARIVSMAIGTCDPRIMLDAPADAARRCLANAGMTTSDIDLWEINEAFAVVPLKFMRELNLNPEVVNVNGGAMALGHPIGATGAMLVGTILDELERRDLSIGLITLCAAGGMAPAMIIERA